MMLLLKNASIFIFLLAISCCNTHSNPRNNSSESITIIDRLEFNNYLIIIEGFENSTQDLLKIYRQQKEQLYDLWAQERIENIYYSELSEINEPDFFPNISFTLKAKNKENALQIVKKLKLITKGHATYSIFPSGVNWLDRKEKNANKKTFVVVENNNNKDSISYFTKLQTEQCLGYWKKGLLENGYFKKDYMKQEIRENPPGIFYLNVKNKAEAIRIIQDLAFEKQNLVSYKLIPVGHFFLGEKEF